MQLLQMLIRPHCDGQRWMDLEEFGVVDQGEATETGERVQRVRDTVWPLGKASGHRAVGFKDVVDVFDVIRVVKAIQYLKIGKLAG